MCLFPAVEQMGCRQQAGRARCPAPVGRADFAAFTGNLSWVGKERPSWSYKAMVSLSESQFRTPKSLPWGKVARQAGAKGKLGENQDPVCWA